MILEIITCYGYFHQSEEITQFTPVPRIGEFVLCKASAEKLKSYPNRNPSRDGYDEFQLVVREVEYDFIRRKVRVYCDDEHRS